MAIPKEAGTFTFKGRTHQKKTTRGLSLCIPWKDGSTSWEPLKDLKESNPLGVAEYVVMNGIQNKPTFAWWVPFALKQTDHIIKTVKSRYQRKWQKYGIEVPKTVQRALEIDKETNTDFWYHALQLEMSKIFPVMNILDESAPTLIGFQDIPCHTIFNVKMDFTRKGRYVAGGHKTQTPEAPTYASVVSCETIRIGLLMAALNDLEVVSTDIAGAYLNAPCMEKVYTHCGLEFGAEYVGRIAIISKALYGLKTSAFAWREHLASTL